MSKIISVILVLVLFFGTTINCFADNEKLNKRDQGMIIIGVLGLGYLLFFLSGMMLAQIAEVETPDDGIGLVSAEEKTPIVTTDDKNILTIIKHVEVGVIQNKNIYIGLCFQY
ncbi:MAG: hypothetical protein LBC52_04595 [Treponema sp.]|jgi:hypothetical protein|nr:hypothetical protein [Treponema sp.]